MLPSSALLCLIVAADPQLPVVQYVGPPSWGSGSRIRRPLDPSRVSVSVYAPNDTLFAATDRVNVRAAPDANAKIVQVAAFGSALAVLERSTAAPVNVSERVDHWYKVRTPSGAVGYLFGGVLTPLLLRLPSSKDPSALVSVSWRWDFDLCLRTFSGGKETLLTARLGGSLRGGAARAWLVDVGVPSPMVVVEIELGSDEREATRWYHAYRYANGQLTELAGNYAHNYSNGVYGFLVFEPRGDRVCTGFENSPRLDICVSSADGQRAALPSDYSGWQRVPAVMPSGRLAGP